MLCDRRRSAERKKCCRLPPLPSSREVGVSEIAPCLACLDFAEPHHAPRVPIERSRREEADNILLRVARTSLSTRSTCLLKIKCSRSSLLARSCSPAAAITSQSLPSYPALPSHIALPSHMFTLPCPLQSFGRRTRPFTRLGTSRRGCESSTRGNWADWAGPRSCVRRRRPSTAPAASRCPPTVSSE